MYISSLVGYSRIVARFLRQPSIIDLDADGSEEGHSSQEHFDDLIKKPTKVYTS